MASPSASTVLERLILAQAVYELGTDAWTAVATLLSKHPLLSPTFSAESCKNAYYSLVEEVGMQSTDRDLKPRSKNILMLAQKLYQARVLELRGQILAEEAKFKTVVAEIDAIRSGAWDIQIRESLGIKDSVHEKPDFETVQQPEVDESLSSASKPKAPADSIVTVDESSPTPQRQSSPAPEKEVEGQQDVENVIHASAKDPMPVPSTADISEVANDAQHVDEESRLEDLTEAVSKVLPDSEPVAELKKDIADDERSPEIRAGSPDIPDENLADIPSASEAFDPDSSRNTEPAESISVQEPSPVRSVGEHGVVMSEPTPTVELEPAKSPVFEPETTPRDHKRKASELDGAQSDSEREKKKMREDSQPADEEDAAPSPGPSRRRGGRPQHEATPASKKFQSVIIMLHSQISQHRNGNIFHNPIKNSEAPDYREIVKRPMDLKTIKMRIKDNTISNSAEFQRDVYLMFANSMMYNRPKSDIYNMAEEMMLESETQINEFRQTEGFVRGGHRL